MSNFKELGDIVRSWFHIVELKGHQDTNWISVKDRLPKYQGRGKNDIVIVSVFDQFNEHIVYYAAIYAYGKSNEVFSVPGWGNMDVTHWMPLPKPAITSIQPRISETKTYIEKPVTKEQAMEIIVSLYNISAKRKLTKQEIEQNKEIQRIYGDEFRQSCLRQAAIANIENESLKNYEDSLTDEF